MSDEAKSAKDRLLELLWDQEWHSNKELREVAGQRYGARLHELRQLGFEISKQSTDMENAKVFEYRLDSQHPSKPKKKKVRVYLDVLDAQMLAVGATTHDAREAVREALDSYYDN